MNVVAEQSFEQLPIDCLQASRTNPRRSFDAAALAELSASIAEHDVQQPLIVRPLRYDGHADVVDAWEIVVGERRWRAAKMAGKEWVPCIIREMTDEEAREIQIVENLQRADVDALEEAEAFDSLLKTLGSVPAVAARLGKEQGYVAKSLRLMALTLPSRDALRGRLISIDYALLLARLAETEQNAALKWCLDRNAGVKTPVEKVVEERTAIRVREAADKEKGERRYFSHAWEPESVGRLKAWIEAESGILLSRAPWSLTDDGGLVADVGPCSECPKNTRANVPLFGDLEMGEATCTDGACFQAKTEGFVRIEQRKAGHDDATKPQVPRLSWKSSTVKPSIVPNTFSLQGGEAETANPANPAKLLKQGQWIEAKKGSCSNVRAGVMMDWSDDGDRGYMGDGKKLRKPGELLMVCIAVGCKAHPKAWEKAKKTASAEKKGLSYEEEHKLEKEKEDAYVAAEAPVRRAVYDAVKAAVKLDADGMLRALMFRVFEDSRNSCTFEFCQVNGFEFTRPADDHWKWRANAREAIRTKLPKVTGAKLVSMAFDAICAHYITPNERMYANRKQDRKAMWEWAQRHGVDAEAIAKGFQAKKAAPGKTAVATKKAAKKAVKKAVAKKAAAPVKKGQKATPAKLSLEARKRIAENMKKRWADIRKAKAKKGAA